LKKGETKGKQIANLEKISNFFKKVLNIMTKTLISFGGKLEILRVFFYLQFIFSDNLVKILEKILFKVWKKLSK
jgi:hypothetical protein